MEDWSIEQRWMERWIHVIFNNRYIYIINLYFSFPNKFAKRINRSTRFAVW